MAKTRRNRVKRGVGQIIFQVVNTLLVVGILGFYLYRGLYYKQYFEDLRNSISLTEPTSLYAALEKRGILDISTFIMNEDGSREFIGKAKNNYFRYSGKLYRAMNIDENGSVKAVSQDVVTIGLLNNGEDFFSSTMMIWLNSDGEHEYSGIYEKMLDSVDMWLTESDLCADKISDTNNIGCSLKKEGYRIGLLSLDDYNRIGGADSYLNNGQSYWLMNQNEEGFYWYVLEDGNITAANRSSQFGWIRPVITIGYEMIVQDGDGSLEHPFTVEEPAVENAEDIRVGSYVSYGERTWHISNRDAEGNLEGMLEGYVMNGEEPYTCQYGKTHDYNVKDGVGKYLNNTYLKTLPDYKDYLVSKTWSYGAISDSKNYDFRDNYTESVECYVMIPNSGSMYLNDYPDIFLSSMDADTHRLIYSFTADGILYADLLETPMKVRPVVCFQGSLKVASGTGTLEDPYVLEVN
ncbi:MAG: hypothetical protein IJS38_00245 [Erysipelotrichaceae bacterium]|nr:hypothetical protein [Erysipelotrichaceae bacterium]